MVNVVNVKIIMVKIIMVIIIMVIIVIINIVIIINGIINNPTFPQAVVGLGGPTSDTVMAPTFLPKPVLLLKLLKLKLLPKLCRRILLQRF